MPGECNGRTARRADMLDDVAFQQSIAHTQMINAAMERLSRYVIAVAALQITERSGRLDKDLKIP